MKNVTNNSCGMHVIDMPKPQRLKNIKSLQSLLIRSHYL